MSRKNKNKIDKALDFILFTLFQKLCMFISFILLNSFKPKYLKG